MEPPPSEWQFPDPDLADPQGLVAVGADLEPGTLIAAYRSGFFPMPVDQRGTMGWWSPEPRGILELDDLHVSRSLRRTRRRFEVTVDRCFRDVVIACGDPDRPHGWITPTIVDAYTRLHELGWAHSVEVWRDGNLAGGLYGVAIGSFFAGESMFHRETDASKVAVVALVERLRTATDALFDVQWQTPHLASLGVSEVGRDTYLDRLAAATAAPGPNWSV